MRRTFSIPWFRALRKRHVPIRRGLIARSLSLSAGIELNRASRDCAGTICAGYPRHCSPARCSADIRRRGRPRLWVLEVAPKVERVLRGAP